ncbi:hypothetical protein LPC10_17800 [Methylorubrum sp. B1-46]|uniref:hypothetical protein n=1 Tax=Methylorubrum TaxID=2282523 RepID=UPI001E64DB75|nr:MULTISPECIES: hypothetical protein [Methylorubrum]MCG5246853.1 hypothetical protein [Methylorubrum extorquens]UGB24785.1 hypothetical protein LPC10_17800 [Methylorubrum sp. B1-46]
MSRAFYTMPVPQQSAFRAAVAAVRDSYPGTTQQEAAFLVLDVDRLTVERTHTLELHARVAERLALTPEADRAGIEAALFGGGAPVVERKPKPAGSPAGMSAWG